MTYELIMASFNNFFGAFAAAITVIMGIVLAGVGLRWLIRVVMK